MQSRETTEDAGCLRLFQRPTHKQDENILVMSEVDFHFNMEAVVELADDWWGSSDRVSIPVIRLKSLKSQIPH